MERITITLQYFDGCPNWRDTRSDLDRVLSELGLEAEVETMLIDTHIPHGRTGRLRDSHPARANHRASHPGRDPTRMDLRRECGGGSRYRRPHVRDRRRRQWRSSRRPHRVGRGSVSDTQRSRSRDSRSRLVGSRRQQPSLDSDLPRPREYAKTYVKFLGLTIVNPPTVIYFVAFVVGLGLADDLTAAQGAAFVAGAFLASLSWQLMLATICRCRPDQVAGSGPKGNGRGW